MKYNFKPYPRKYPNGGHEAERLASLNFLGVERKPDNKPFWAGADVGVLQVKTQKASVCKGTDIRAHIEQDAAELYCYVLADFTACYVMRPETWALFVDRFAYITRDSSGPRGERGGSNGGGIKLKLLGESRAMRAWLEANALYNVEREV